MSSRFAKKSLEVGPGKLESIGAALKRSNLKGNALLVSGSHVWEEYGSSLLSQLEIVADVEVHKVKANTMERAMSLAQSALLGNTDFIVGFGGGKATDVGKYAAYIAKKPYVSIPTTLANDGLVSAIAVLKDPDSLPRSLGCRMPDVAILDTDIVMDGPHDLIKAGIGDTISNYTALIDWDIAVRAGRETENNYARLMSSTALDSLLNSRFDRIDDDFLIQLANSLIFSGIAMENAGSSRPVSGSEHLFSHALDFFCPQNNLHGIQTALGTIAVLALTNRPRKRLLEYLNRFEVDVNPARLGIGKDYFIECFQKAPSMRPGRYTCLNECDLSTETLEQLYEQIMEETR